METEWHYEKGGTTNGPVSASGLRALRRDGVIGDDSLVWRDGLAGWLPYADRRDELENAAPPALGPNLGLSGQANEPVASCAWSGKTLPESQMLRYGEQWVAPEYKDLFVQRLREGEPPAQSGFLPEDERVTDLNFVSILIQTLKIWRVNAVSILVVLVVICFPLSLLVEYQSYHQEVDVETDGWLEALKSLRGGSPLEKVANFLTFVLTGAVLFAAHQSWIGKPKLPIGTAFYSGFSNWLRLVGTNILNGLLAGLLSIPGIILIVFGHWLPVFLGVIYLIIALPIYLVRHAFIDPIAIADAHGGMHALERSRVITRGRFWLVLLYQMVVYGIVLTLIIGGSVLLIIPGLDNFVVSAFHTVASSGLMVFAWIESYVFHRHLEANPAQIKT